MEILSNRLNYPLNYPNYMSGTLTKKIVIKDDHIRNDGTCALYLQVFVNKKRKRFPLKVFVNPKFFDKKNQRVKSSHPTSVDYNLIIENELSKVNDIAISYRLRNQYLTLDNLCKEIENPNSRISFVKFYETNLEKQLKDQKIEIATYKQQRSTLRKIKAFKNEIFFYEIDQTLVDDFMAYLKVKLKNSENTRLTALKNFKKYLHLANDEKIFTPIDYKSIKVKSIKGNRTFLEANEVNLLFEYYTSKFIKTSHKSVLKKFLFSCFTGLRISDVQQLTQMNFIGDYIVFNASKGGKFQKIKLNQSALKFINTEGSVFDDNFTDQTINEYLKEISNICGIRKKVTFHVSRHTFATHYLISGGHIENLQQILGHSKIDTTMIYVHIVKEHLNEDMRKMDSILKF